MATGWLYVVKENKNKKKKRKREEEEGRKQIYPRLADSVSNRAARSRGPGLLCVRYVQFVCRMDRAGTQSAPRRNFSTFRPAFVRDLRIAKLL